MGPWSPPRPVDLPLRERNRLLLAAGYAPAYPEAVLEESRMEKVRLAVRQVLAGHEPYPAVVLDSGWRIIDANASLSVVTERVAPWLLVPPANALRASLHPDGLAPHIINLAEWRAHLLARLHRQVDASGDPELIALEEELRTYPGGQPESEFHDLNEIVVPLRIRRGDEELRFFSTVATFGTPLDITVSELVIESFYPADEYTARALRDQQRPVGVAS